MVYVNGLMRMKIRMIMKIRMKIRMKMVGINGLMRVVSVNNENNNENENKNENKNDEGSEC